MIFPKRILSLGLALIFLAAGVYFLILKKPAASQDPPKSGEAGASQSASNPGPDQGAGQAAAEAAPLPVKAVTAARGDLVIRMKSPGEAYTDNKAVIKAEVSGIARTVLAEEGKHVRAGEVLIVIDDEKYRFELERAEATRLKSLSEMLIEKQFEPPAEKMNPEKAEKIRLSIVAMEKAASDLASGAISKSDFDTIQKTHEIVLIDAGARKEEIRAAFKSVTQNEIDVANARIQLAKTKIIAPFDGIVTGVKAFTWETVSPGQELFTLVNIRRIRVVAKVLESEIGRIRPGQAAELTFSSFPGKVFQGTVQAVSPVVNAEDKTCGVYILVDNPTEEIKPGMHAEVDIAAEVHQGRLLVPQDAVLLRNGRKLVFVVEDGLAKWKYVDTGLENERYVEILNGIVEGEKVIVEGHLTLAHDARVTIDE
jgi:RND family efflux transporter MFP subunit